MNSVMERTEQRTGVPAGHALPALGYFAVIIWMLAAASDLSATHAAPIYAHIATALWALFPILIGGTLHMAVVKDDRFDRLAKPIHREWFGSTKTWRGVLAMSIFSIVGAYALDVIFGPSLAHATFDFHRLTPAELGLALGVTFILAELPNSYVKRRLGIAAGGRADRYQFVFTLGDQLDSVVACGLLYVFALGMPWITFLVLLPVGVVTLLIVKRALFHLGLKRAPT
jgi:CDP-diacylglycerol--serine O-phosphatidyltransferase